MKISLLGYNSWKAVLQAVGPATTVMYTQENGTVQLIAAITAKHSVSASHANYPVTTILTDFPAAIEVVLILEVGG